MSDASPAAEAPKAPEPGGKPAPDRRKIRLVLIGGGLILAVIGVFVGLNWWLHGRFVESTDDAYVRADAVTAAPRVSGYIGRILVGDNQLVAAGQVLATIEAGPYASTFTQQQAAADARRAELADADNQLDQQKAVIDQDLAQLAGAQANARFAEHEARRYAGLSAQGAETRQRYAQALNQRDQDIVTWRTDADTVRIAQHQLASLKYRVIEARAQLKAAQAAAHSALINLQDTEVRASIAGQVGDSTVRLGQYVQPGTRLMSIVPVNDAYVVANFKETQIARIRVGQKAKVEIDALGGKTIDGVVDSFSPGTGSEFALLPPENATGNFTKIVQRVPVRLRLQVPPELRDHLLPGLSANVSIDTAQAPENRQ